MESEARGRDTAPADGAVPGRGATSSSGVHQASTRRPRLSVVVPCYNEERVLPELKRRLVAACQCQVGDDFEVILVNDGSRDGTWEQVAAMTREIPNVVGVNLSRNVGHQLALTAGLTMCRGHRVLIIDADLQDPPELLPDMMAAMDAGADVVYGQRKRREGEGVFKRSTAYLFYRLLSMLSEVKIPMDTGDFRLINRKVLDVLNGMPEQYRFIRGMVAWLGFKQVPLVYTRDRRFAGTTKYPFWKMIRFATDAITGFSISPLRISTYLALFCFLLTGVLGAYVVYAWIALSVVRGWTSLLLVFLMFTGVQLLVLGVIGEYVGRTYVESKGRPLFIVNEILCHSGHVESRHERGV